MGHSDDCFIILYNKVAQNRILRHTSLDGKRLELMTFRTSSGRSPS